MPTTPLQLQLFPGVPESTPEPSPAAPPPPPPAEGKPPAPQPAAPRFSQLVGLPLLARLQEIRPDRFRSVTLTDNRSTIVSAREAEGGLDVRIHRCFVAASDDTLGAVADFLTAGKRSARRRRALAAIRDFFRRHRPPAAAARRRRRIVLRPVGQCFDLRELRDALNRRYFGGELEVHVTWGRAPARARRRRGASVRLGTYSDRDRLVRIHRCLDRPWVPRYVVESVVYHEMLHAAVPPVVKNGRRRIHTPEFRRRERLFRHYEKAERWIERNLKRLLE